MALYQKTVLGRYIKALDKKAIQEKYEVFKAHFHNPTIQANIKKSKEEQYQEGFLTDLFVNILGYIKNPNEGYNLTTELKNVKDAKKTDGAIIIENKVVAVIELKSTSTTNLDSIEIQAFNYKNNQVGCNYVITSNFQKIRLYIDNAVTHQEWDLFTLTEEQFQELYISLAFENIKSDLPKTIKDKSLSEQDTITKKLYKDYANFKKELYQDLVTNNPEIDQLTLFKKSQKLLDRFLFLFFAEDRGLLQPQSVRTIVKRWNQAKDLDLYLPLMDSYRKYFGYLNDGYQSKDLIVYAYNGGLFAPDDILDKVIVSDDVLEKNTLKISDYDFESEVDVNILGHIFENSLNELEEVQAEIRGEVVEKTKTKRKKDGVFYTPKYITKYIVDNTVGKLCNEKKEELKIKEEEYSTEKNIQSKTKKALIEKLDTYRQWLLQLTICDPACGSGAFLNQALEFLIEEHAYIDELQAKLFGDALILTDIEGSILENNLYGVDINEESIEIAKLSLWLRTAEPNRKLTSLSNNLKSGNSLIDDLAVAGDKAFNWEQEFPHVFEKGGFDVIIGNPPYVFGGNNGISIIEKKYYFEKFKTGKGKVNLFTLFIEKSHCILKENGEFSFIIPNTFLRVTSYNDSRIFFINNFLFRELADLGNDVFQGAVTSAIILIATKRNVDLNSYLKIIKDFSGNYITNSIKNIISNDYIISTSDDSNNLINKLKIDSIDLIDIAKEMIFGVVISKNANELIFENDENNSLKPFLEGKDINSYLIRSNKFLKYDSKKLHRARTPDIFEVKEKLLIQRITGGKKPIKVAYDNKQFYNKESINNLILKDDVNFEIKFILTLLNSKLINWFYSNSFTNGSTLTVNISKEYLSKIPIKNISLEAQQPFIEMADKMLALNKDLQNAATKFSKLLASELELTEPSKKLQEWYNLEFTDFAKELKKKKIELSLAQKAEWMDFFESEKQKVNQIQAEIQATDKLIDQMVYDLYELTPEEIQIVENS